MSNILERAFWGLKPFQGFSKNPLLLHFCGWSLLCWNYASMINLELMLSNMLRPTFVPNLMALTWKMGPRMAKNGQLIKWSIFVHIQWGRTSIMELIQDLRMKNVLATFENNPRKLWTWEHKRWFSMCKVGKCTKNSHKKIIKPGTYVN